MTTKIDKKIQLPDGHKTLIEVYIIKLQFYVFYVFYDLHKMQIDLQ